MRSLTQRVSKVFIVDLQDGPIALAASVRWAMVRLTSLVFSQNCRNTVMMDGLFLNGNAVSNHLCKVQLKELLSSKAILLK